MIVAISLGETRLEITRVSDSDSVSVGVRVRVRDWARAREITSATIRSHGDYERDNDMEDDSTAQFLHFFYLR
jgi:hypothetical protein